MANQLKLKVGDTIELSMHYAKNNADYLIATGRHLALTMLPSIRLRAYINQIRKYTLTYTFRKRATKLGCPSTQTVIN